MPFVDDSNIIFLGSVDQFSDAYDAAHFLWHEIHGRTKTHGGSASLRSPEDGEWGYLVTWVFGPEGWANKYAASDDSSAHGFVCTAEENAIRFTDS